MNVENLLNASRQRPVLRFDPKMIRDFAKTVPQKKPINDFMGYGNIFPMTAEQMVNAPFNPFFDD
ncbi:hypothetical protein BKE30_13675 [Alkanindiges hydrocarboniclasticus]|uniref:Uncharacterized protein n=1 Tax=Alkanindiges hydrocarboniclasticus TaxID=1907941 RepID=A0A1S8CQW8_9GAMM|nr:hypothetical protein [Alkanindiges hydrocarboniclasticus]ONG37853.1 hypothetical protein BKE30_13675 [Alkanindiges hydrocarboniclasticus]